MKDRRSFLRLLGLGALCTAVVSTAPRAASASTETLASRMRECAEIRAEIDRFVAEWRANFEAIKKLEWHTEAFRAREAGDAELEARIFALEDSLAALERMPT